ncbi:MAG: FkbM family methyltransferase, partial [Candidatus Margulisbacteria bacterium]|nr:FkbM family methyltransferase [Candidatus Margulisiibacteriota bacterium]
IISENNIVIADIGAAGGIDARWYQIKKFTKFVCFEPDKRSAGSVTESNSINFPIALSDTKGRKELYLTPFPDASSLYPLNAVRLDDYANFEAHKIISSTEIDVDTLDNCLLTQPGLALDFIKLDVEGADLDVLKGATSTLNAVKGIQVEVSFLERYVGAPLFGDVDAFLRERGFELFILKREHWLRKNLVYGVNSSPQIIWADAVYFLRRKSFENRLSQLPDERKIVELVKFVVLLLSYGLHDYAVEIVDSISKLGFVPVKIIDQVKQSIKSSVDNVFSAFLKRSLAVLFAFFVYLLLLPLKSTRGEGRKYLKKQLGALSRWFSRITRGGPYNACLHD